MWDTLIKIALVAFGWSLGFLADHLRRRRVRAAQWRYLAAEAELCALRADGYAKHDAVTSPVYRLPLVAFKAAMPSLVLDGTMAKHEFSKLLEFFSWCEDINRGLDYAHDARTSDASERFGEEVRRLKAKCSELLSDHLPSVIQIFKRHGAGVSIEH